MPIRTLLTIALVAVAVTGASTSPRYVSGFTVSDDLAEAHVIVGSQSIAIPLSLDEERAELQVTQHGPFTIEYYPRTLYQSVGDPTPGVVQLVTSVPHRPTVSEVAGGPDGMAELPHPWLEPDLPASLAELYASFEALNDLDAGRLCPEMTGLETYRSIEAGDCYVVCTGYARMTHAFLRTEGVPARLLTLGGGSARTLSSGVLVQSSEGHTALERWDGDQWALVDPTFQVREVALDGRTLSLYETILALAHDRRDEVTFTRYLDGAWQTATYADQDDAFIAALARYYTADKQLSAH